MLVLQRTNRVPLKDIKRDEFYMYKDHIFKMVNFRGQLIGFAVSDTNGEPEQASDMMMVDRVEIEHISYRVL